MSDEMKMVVGRRDQVEERERKKRGNLGGSGSDWFDLRPRHCTALKKEPPTVTIIASPACHGCDGCGPDKWSLWVPGCCL